MKKKELIIKENNELKNELEKISEEYNNLNQNYTLSNNNYKTLKLLNEKIIKEKEELISKNKNNDINLIKSQYDSLLNEYNKLKQNDQINNDHDNDNDNEINELIKIIKN